MNTDCHNVSFRKEPDGWVLYSCWREEYNFRCNQCLAHIEVGLREYSGSEVFRLMNRIIFLSFEEGL